MSRKMLVWHQKPGSADPTPKDIKTVEAYVHDGIMGSGQRPYHGFLEGYPEPSDEEIVDAQIGKMAHVLGVICQRLVNEGILSEYDLRNFTFGDADQQADDLAMRIEDEVSVPKG